MGAPEVALRHACKLNVCLLCFASRDDEHVEYDVNSLLGVRQSEKYPTRS